MYKMELSVSDSWIVVRNLHMRKASLIYYIFNNVDYVISV